MKRKEGEECPCFQCGGEPRIEDDPLECSSSAIVAVPEDTLRGWLKSLEKVPLVEYQDDYDKMKSDLIDQMQAENRMLAAEIRGVLR